MLSIPLLFAIILLVFVEYRYTRLQRKIIEKTLAKIKRELPEEFIGQPSNKHVDSPAPKAANKIFNIPRITLKKLGQKRAIRKLESAERNPRFDKLTLVIPTYNRHQYLARAIDYYRHWNIKILITDSTTDPYRGVLSQNIRYWHRPEVPWSKKLEEAISFVKTSYLLMVADDDFMSPLGVGQALNYLEKNSECCSAQGRHTSFTRYPSYIKWHSIHLFAANYHVHGNNVRSRLEQQLSPYMNNFYAVHRTAVLKDFFCRVCPTLSPDIISKRPDLLEIGLALTSAAWGSHISLPVFWIAREVLKDTAFPSQSSDTNSDVNEKIIFNELTALLTSHIGDENINEFSMQLLDSFRLFRKKWNQLEISHFGSIKASVRSSEEHVALNKIITTINNHNFGFKTR